QPRRLRMGVGSPSRPSPRAQRWGFGSRKRALRPKPPAWAAPRRKKMIRGPLNFLGVATIPLSGQWLEAPHRAAPAAVRPGTTMHPLLSDPWFAAMLDAALARHRGRFTARQQAAFRQQIAWSFSTHPAARRILLRERPALAALLGSPPFAELGDEPPRS